MGLDPSPVHMRSPEPDPIRVDVINEWPQRSFAIGGRRHGNLPGRRLQRMPHAPPHKKGTIWAAETPQKPHKRLAWNPPQCPALLNAWHTATARLPEPWMSAGISARGSFKLLARGQTRVLKANTVTVAIS